MMTTTTTIMNKHQDVDLLDPKLLLSPPVSFKCGERIHSLHSQEDDEEEEQIGRVEFTCTIPDVSITSSNQGQCEDSDAKDMDSRNKYQTKTIRCRCRDQSVGFLNSNESSTQDDEEEEHMMDPNFFDTGYTLAGKTGFQIWAGSRVMMEILLPWSFNSSSNTDSRNSGDCEKKLVDCADTNDLIEYYQKRIMDGASILELGAGVGVVGTALAAVGGQVLMTDLPSLVDYSMWPNIIDNAKEEDNPTNDASWLGGERKKIHHGWAVATPLDWTRPVHEQISQEQIESINIIISCDCVWLVSMLDGLMDSVSAVFQRSKANDIAFLMSFQRRDTKEGSQSSTFTTVERVLSSVEERGWKLRCLAWRPVIVRGDNDFKQEKEVFVFEIKPV